MIPAGAAAAPDHEREKLRAAARALETLVLKQLVAASKAFTGGEGPGSAVRADLFADALADAMVKGGGIGLAAQIARSVDRTAAAELPSPTSFVPLGQRTGPAVPTSAGAAPLEEDPAPEPEDPEQGAGSATARSQRVTSPYGLRHDPFDGHLTRHNGVDLAASEGDPIVATAAGVVRRSGAIGGYGNAVEIDHGGGLTTLYGHASELLVRDGERVAPGQPIARVGHTGRATGPHVHFEVRQGGHAIDPSRALKIYGVRADETFKSGS